MNSHLCKHVDELLSRSQQVILGTCGPAGPQVSQVGSAMRGSHLILKVDRTSDHLFNLEFHPGLALLTPEWELHGTGRILKDGANVFLHSWEVAIEVVPIRIHLLDPESLRRIETVDFPT